MFSELKMGPKKDAAAKAKPSDEAKKDTAPKDKPAAKSADKKHTKEPK